MRPGQTQLYGTLTSAGESRTNNLRVYLAELQVSGRHRCHTSMDESASFALHDGLTDLSPKFGHEQHGSP
jgi:hypothetical protein